MTHLNALLMNLSNERIRLSNAKTQSERDLRTVWVKQLEKEVASEEKFVGENQMSDDELLAALA
jgi:hypothetical protein